MRDVLVVFMSICALAAPPVQGQSIAPEQRLTEIDAVERLSPDDPRLRAIRARVDEVRAAQAGRALRANPVLSWSREHVNETSDHFLLARQEIDLSGRLGHLRAAGRLAVEAAEADAAYRTAQLHAQVRLAFTRLLLAQSRETALAAAIDELRRLTGILRARENAGEGSRYDHMRGQRALIDLEADLGAEAAARIEAQGRLAGLLAAPAGTVLVADGRLDVPPPPAPVAELVQRAFDARGDLLAAAAAARQFGEERNAASRLAVPTPSLTAGMKRSDILGATHTGYLVSLDVSVPLFSRGQTSVASAAAQARAAEADAEALRRQIDADVRAAHAALAVQRDRTERYTTSMAESVESLASVARLGYEEGELGILELLDAVRQSLDGRLRALDLAATARQAAIELDRVVGREIRP